MLWRASQFSGYSIHAKDGQIGSVVDLLFDDTDWTVRWGLIDTGTWLAGRLVLLPTTAFGNPDPAKREFPVELTRDRVESSPSVDTDAPVSRQMEKDIYAYYGWTPYWGVVATYSYPGYVPPPTGAVAGSGAAAGAGYPRSGRGNAEGDPHLRSTREVTGYYVRATDDSIGHVEEILVDDAGWVIRYLVIDTRNWWPGKKVLVSPQWFRDVSWGEQQVLVDLTREQVRNSPEYDPSITVDRGYEDRLYQHYGYRPYWV